MWYLAEAPALSAVACISVPALTLLSGSTRKKNPLSLCGGERGFSCPVEQSTGPGRPRFYIPKEVIRGFRDVRGVWKEVAKEVLVSYKTTLRRRHQYSMAVSNTTGPRIFQMQDFVVRTKQKS